MLFFGIKNSWFRLGIFLVLTVPAALFVYWLYDSYYVTDPYNPNLQGTQAYGHNGEGAFELYGMMTLIEYAVLLGVLLPFSFSRFYFVRLIILQAVFGFWLFMMFFSAMHSGNTHIIHMLWTFFVNVIIFVLLILSIIAEVVGKNKLQQTANH